MVKFINKLTGTEMWVANDRVEKYKAAGHALAADLGTKPVVKPVPEQKASAKPAETAKKKVIRKK